jgi:hypothetical protein
VRRQRQDFHHMTALALVRAYDTIYVEAIQPANLSRRPAPKQDEHGNGGYAHNGPARRLVSTRAFTMLGGTNSCPFSRTRQHAPVSECKRCQQRTPPRSVPICDQTGPSVGNGCARACLCARMCVHAVATSRTATRTRPETSYGAGSAFGDSRGCLRE